MVSIRECGVCVLLSLVVFCFCVYFGEATNCYECNSHSDSGCDAEKPPDSYKTNCTAKYNESYVLCRKAVLQTESGLRGKTSSEKRIIRSCGWDNSSYINDCYRRTGAGWHQMTCTCDFEYCNSAPRRTVTATSLALLLISALHLL